MVLGGAIFFLLFAMFEVLYVFEVPPTSQLQSRCVLQLPLQLKPQDIKQQLQQVCLQAEGNHRSQIRTAMDGGLRALRHADMGRLCRHSTVAAGWVMVIVSPQQQQQQAASSKQQQQQHH